MDNEKKFLTDEEIEEIVKTAEETSEDIDNDMRKIKEEVQVNPNAELEQGTVTHEIGTVPDVAFATGLTVSEKSIFDIEEDGESHEVESDISYEALANSSGTSDLDETEIYALLNVIESYKKDKSIGSSLKEKFVIMVDFLFYGGKIGNKTFSELSDSAKIKVLEIALSIDEKIDKHFPGYKETISTSTNKVYTSVKTKAMELYLNITTDLCNSNSNLCESARDGLDDLKTNFSMTWDFIKDKVSSGTDKLEDWYKVWKNK